LRYLTVSELARRGYRVIEAATGEEALKAAAQHGGAIHLLITDVVMPKIGGLELARRFRSSLPQSPVLFISGYDTLTEAEPRASVLAKPFGNDALLARVRELLDAAGAAASP
jgi:DNA-binding response OmpR family regulator